MKALAIALVCFGAAAHAAAPAANPPVKAEPAPKVETRVVEPVNYEQLTDKVGREIVVITTLGTKRRGTLQRITKSAIIIKLDEKSGGIDLDLPRDSVRKVELVSEPMPTVIGEDSAKKK